MKQSSGQETPWLRIVLTAIPLVALMACYCSWLFSHTHPNTAGMILSAVSVLLFAVLGIRFIPQWMQAWSGNAQAPVRLTGKRSGRFARMHPTIQLIFLLLASRIAVYIAAYLILLLKHGYQGGILDLMQAWNPGSLDSRHYLYIAENGYTAIGDERLNLVFFPLYPLIVKAFSYLTGNGFAAGLLVSNLAFIGAGILLYELTAMDHGRDTGLRAAVLLCLLPAGILFCAPMSDSLFLLESLACVYLTRKGNYLGASIMGCLAAFTRLPGVLLLAPVLFELIGQTVAQRKAGVLRLPVTIGHYASLVLLPIGTLLYLYLNYRVTGSCLTFLTYQKENWHQGMGWFFSTAEYQLNYALSCWRDGDLETLLGLWLPNLVSLLGSIGIVALAQHRMRPSYTAYFILYYAVTMGATWLLSAPRYLTVAFPMIIALALLLEKKSVRYPALLLFFALSLFYLYAFLMRWSVY